MSYGQTTKYTEDLFADTRMSLGEHLEDLRGHRWRAAAGFAIIMAFVFLLDGIGLATGLPIGIGTPVMRFISSPVENQLQRLYDQRTQRAFAKLHEDAALQAANAPFVRYEFCRDQLLAALQGQPASVVNHFPRPVTQAEQNTTGGETDRPVTSEEQIYELWVRRAEPDRDMALWQHALAHVGKQPALKLLSLTEGLMVYLKVAGACGLVLGCPWVLWQLWAFVAAGLYPHERRSLFRYLPFSLLLFLAGILFCEFWVLPKTVEALLWFNESLGFEPDLRLSEWIGFAVLMPLVFGLSFQMPVVMLFLGRLGVLTVDSYRNKRRLAWFLMAIFAAVATPSPDAQAMLLLWVPLVLLYECGILLCQLISPES